MLNNKFYLWLVFIAIFMGSLQASASYRLYITNTTDHQVYVSSKYAGESSFFKSCRPDKAWLKSFDISKPGQNKTTFKAGVCLTNWVHAKVYDPECTNDEALPLKELAALEAEYRVKMADWRKAVAQQKNGDEADVDPSSLVRPEEPKRYRKFCNAKPYHAPAGLGGNNNFQVTKGSPDDQGFPTYNVLIPRQ